MANGDYGYFGKGDTGYAQYMTAFNRNFGGSSGGGGGRAGAPRYGELRASLWHKAALREPVTENLTRKYYHIATGNTNNIPMEDFNTLTATCMVCG